MTVNVCEGYVFWTSENCQDQDSTRAYHTIREGLLRLYRLRRVKIH